MQPEPAKVNWEPYLRGGALGGNIGGLVVFIFAGVYSFVYLGADSVLDLMVIVGISELIIGSIMGIMVGSMVYRVTKRLKAQPNSVLRFLIGAGYVLVIELLINLANWRIAHLGFEVVFAVAVGGVAGLMSRAKRPAASAPVAAGA